MYLREDLNDRDDFYYYLNLMENTKMDNFIKEKKFVGTVK